MGSTLFDAQKKPLQINSQSFELTATDFIRIGIPYGIHDLARVSLKFESTLRKANYLCPSILRIGSSLDIAEAGQLIDRETNRLLGHTDRGSQFRDSGPFKREMRQNVRMGILQSQLTAIAELFDHFGKEVLTDSQ